MRKLSFVQWLQTRARRTFAFLAAGALVFSPSLYLDETALAREASLWSAPWTCVSTCSTTRL